MNQVRHILAKDLWRLRWGILGWLALIGARTLVNTAGADVALGGYGPQIGIDQVSVMLSVIDVLLLALLVSYLVHGEALVGRDTFWITRPITPGALMSAKLAFAAFLFVCVPLAGSLVVAAVFGTSGGDVARTIPVFLLNQLVLIALLMALAALTPSLTRYALAIVGVFAAFVLVVSTYVLVALLLAEDVGDASNAGLPDSTPAIVRGVLLMVVALAVIVYQYHRRWLSRALTMLAIGVALVFIIPNWWPWSFADRSPGEMAETPQDTPALAVALDGSRPRVSDAFTLRRRVPPKKDIVVRATVTGVPPAFTVHPIVSRSRLELPGGLALQTGGDGSTAARLESWGGLRAGRETSLEAALGGVRLITRSNATEAGASTEPWPLLLKVDEGTFVSHRSEPGLLTANVDLLFERPVVRAVLPLADGARADFGRMRISIVRIIRRATGCTVLLRRSYVEPLVSPPRYRNFTFVLRNQARREAARSDVEQPLSQYGFSTAGFFVPTPHIGGRGFVLEQYELQFPPRHSPDSPLVDLDEAWLAGSELVILEAIPAGRISRTVTIEGFRMTP